eukprot:3999411-Prymnesium_polylepis.1
MQMNASMRLVKLPSFCTRTSTCDSTSSGDKEAAAPEAALHDKSTSRESKPIVANLLPVATLASPRVPAVT